MDDVGRNGSEDDAVLMSISSPNVWDNVRLKSWRNLSTIVLTSSLPWVTEQQELRTVEGVGVSVVGT